ncbi:DNA adenine methylase [Micromonospora sp. NPDC000316]|uniref:DNA adenine methylase n=1 Tax=Micromonospora sp. NPDC000316 TaxID=3364216 RepID=UPI0036B5C782
MTTPPLPELPSDARRAVAMASKFPRIRYMGSKYKLVERLSEVFAGLGGASAIDAFTGSGVVSYALKALGYSVTSNDFLNFSGTIARAVVVNQGTKLSSEEVDWICEESLDGRDFIQQKFEGLYFTPDDRKFLDSAWSHIDLLETPKRDLAIAGLVLAAARKQPRGVFTFTDLRYDDGRRDLRLSLKEHFRETVEAYNDVVFDGGQECFVTTGDVFDLPSKRYDIAYLDPPYAPPRDDNCYIKRYHFLEGLSVYWRGQTILEHTKTKKLAKLYTPFSYKHSIEDALQRTFKQFHESTIVLSYSSNAVPDLNTITRLLGEIKDSVEVHTLQHKYSFGTHAAATRRDVLEYIIVGR